MDGASARKFRSACPLDVGSPAAGCEPRSRFGIDGRPFLLPSPGCFPQKAPDWAIQLAASAILDGMADDLRVNSALAIPAGELRERFSRSSGPGGQSVNTTDSRVELSFDVLRSPSLPERERERALARLEARLADGVVTVAAEGERSQLMNREAARARLAALL